MGVAILELSDLFNALAKLPLDDIGHSTSR